MKRFVLISLITFFSYSLYAQVLTGANIDTILDKAGIESIATFLRIKKYTPLADSSDYWGYYVVWGNNCTYDYYGNLQRIDRTRSYHRVTCYFENDYSKPYRLYYESGTGQPLANIIKYYISKGYKYLGTDENGSEVYGKDKCPYEIHYHKESLTFAIYIVKR